jgi:alpha-N-arabinofuranosidase
MVSLLPRETWNNRPNGLRKDLVQWLADLKPGFLRFPGGCIGRRLGCGTSGRTVGGRGAARLINRWAGENDRSADSRSAGLLRSAQLAEDIGASPPHPHCGWPVSSLASWRGRQSTSSDAPILSSS